MELQTNRTTTMSDEQIVELYWRRDERAIKETDIKYRKFLLSVAYNILHDTCDSEECLNDTYLGAWKAIPPARPVAFSAFITRIMRNIAVNRFKEINCKKRIPSELTVSLEEMNSALHGECSAEKEYEAREVGKIINDFVRKLSERQRYIFIDRFYLAEPVETIAKNLSISVPTVYRETEKIKQGLKNHLERNEVFI